MLWQSPPCPLPPPPQPTLIIAAQIINNLASFIKMPYNNKSPQNWFIILSKFIFDAVQIKSPFQDKLLEQTLSLS